MIENLRLGEYVYCVRIVDYRVLKPAGFVISFDDKTVVVDGNGVQFFEREKTFRSLDECEEYISTLKDKS